MQKAITPATALIEFRNVTKIYGHGEGRVRALDGVSLRIGEGEFVAVMGPSGSGKSTAMNIIGCLDQPTSGSYLFSGIEVGRLDRKQRALLRRHYLGFVFQGFNLLARTTAIENVELPLIYRGMAPARRRRQAMQALAHVGLAGREHHSPGELSGGQQQRVAIARAIVTQPAVLLADEPTGNLDERATWGIFDLFREINTNGTAVLFATHNLELVRRNPGFRVIELEHGKVVFDSTTEKRN
jgi:putative ABC transport system ATP-binding protein